MDERGLHFAAPPQWEAGAGDRVVKGQLAGTLVRAVLHNAAQTGLEAQNREDRDDFRAYLAGMAGHVSAASEAQGTRRRDALGQLRG